MLPKIWVCVRCGDRWESHVRPARGEHDEVLCDGCGFVISPMADLTERGAT